VGKALQLNETLAYMAALVRENPNITVREIANRMNFSDNKSVYYWLRKGNYQGIGEFKQAVLTELDGPEGINVLCAGKSQFLIKIPMRPWHNRKPEPVEQWFYCFYDYPNPRGIFAVTVETNEFSPWFYQHDILVINTNTAITGPAWVLGRKGRSYAIYRCDTNQNLYHPDTLVSCPRTGITILGQIIQLVRQWR